MISCEHVKKIYGNQKVFEDFSYEFKSTGFYLLFGVSGSGKTTLLNILAGHIPFDDGVIEFNGEKYSHQVNAEAVSSQVDYITQDSNFVDYLSVYDNLALCTTDDETIDKYLEQFKLTDKKDVLPGKLSGGERQRICLIRSLIQNKKVILLDEPTASLDNENKRLVFETLKNLKESVLIICSSHDGVAKEYADECINFSNLKACRESIGSTEKVRADETCESSKKVSKRKIGPYIGKWFKSPFKEKRSRIRFCVVMVLAIMALCLGDVPENKFASSVEYIYRINQLNLWIDEDKFDYMDYLYDREDIKEIVMQYTGSVPDGIDPNDPTDVSADADYELAAWTLPINRDNFHISDPLAYGRYIENENEIILSDAMAAKLGNPEELIGTTKRIKLYGGEYDMTIVGIFRDFTEVERQYLLNSGMMVFDDKSLYDSCYAISADFTNKYVNDYKFAQVKLVGDREAQRNYVLYFDSYSDMKKFYDEVYIAPEETNGIMFSPPVIEYALQDVFFMMYTYMFPISILVMCLAVLFYFQTQKTELVYNKKIFVAFQYLGYPIRKVKGTWIFYSILELIKLLCLSGVFALAATYIINIVNRKAVFVSYELFSYNIEVMLCLFGILIVIGIVNAIFMLRKLKPGNISENLVGQRDLL